LTGTELRTALERAQRRSYKYGPEDVVMLLQIELAGLALGIKIEGRDDGEIEQDPGAEDREEVPPVRL